ncbi:hypothetical protein INR49_032495 [Caranx melampygus]|nr:hypothetical protein INR49_032495 [Caranx melampygus]
MLSFLLVEATMTTRFIVFGLDWKINEQLSRMLPARARYLVTPSPRGAAPRPSVHHDAEIT